MPHPLIVPDAAYAADLDAAVQAHRDGVERLGKEEDRRPRHAGPIVVCLLDDLESGRSVEAERLRWEDQSEVWDLQVLGFPTSNLPFRLRLQNANLTPGDDDEEDDEDEADEIDESRDAISEVIRLNADVTEMTEALAADEIWRQHLRSVTIGQHGRGVMRWRIALSRRPDGQEHQIQMLPPPEGNSSEQNRGNRWWQIGGRTVLQLEPTQYVGSGRLVTVHSPVPLGDPSPARRGAIAVCVPLPRGWGVVSLEPRRFRAAWPLQGPPPEEYGY